MPISSIWSNNFYNSPPVPTWAFEVDFKSFFVNAKDDTYATSLSKAVVSCSWGGRDANLIPVYYAGVEAKLPGRASMAKDLTIKFNENSTLIITKILEETYHAEINCDSFFYSKEGYAFNKWFNKCGRKISVIIHKPDILMQQDPLNSEYEKNILARITYHNCILYKIDEQELSYESEDEVITRTATFSYDFMTVQGNLKAGTTINSTCLANI